jgi:8-oxo-dGTP pyrophosphatase MutT (NUDIX family)
MSTASESDTPRDRARGGEQRIPRPGTHRPGPLAAWSEVVGPEFTVTMADVRRTCAALPPAVGPIWAAAHARPTAVLLPIYELVGEVRIILTKRPMSMRSHQGEVSFPGGKFEPQLDTDLAATARRETEEEIGIPRESVEILGELDSLSTFASQFTIAPFVGALAVPPVLQMNAYEVDAIIDVAITDLLSAETYRSEAWDLRGIDGMPDADNRVMHFFELPGETVWGATGRILYGFLAALTGVPVGDD